MVKYWANATFHRISASPRKKPALVVTVVAEIAIAVNVVNIVASWLLSGVEVRFGALVVPNPSPVDPAVGGVLGIAGGTAASYACGAALIVWVLLRGVKDMRLEMRESRLGRTMTWRIIRIGVPNFAEGMAMWGVNLFVMRFIGIVAAAGTANSSFSRIRRHGEVPAVWPDNSVVRRSGQTSSSSRMTGSVMAHALASNDSTKSTQAAARNSRSARSRS